MRGNEHHIFYPDSSPVGQIDAGFYRKDHPFLDEPLIFTVDHRVLMNSKAYAVACSVTEIFHISLVPNVIPCRTDHLMNGNDRSNPLNRFVVSFMDYWIDFLLF